MIVEEDVDYDDLAGGANIVEDTFDDEDELTVPEEDVAESTYRVIMEVDRELDDDVIEAGVEPWNFVNPLARQT